jgi:hypothetical protein
MKKNNSAATLLVLVGVLLSFEDCKDQSTNPDNSLHTCSITYPLNEARIIKGNSFEISVDVTDNDGSISYFKFWIDGESRFFDTKSPYVYQWDTSSEFFRNHTIGINAEDDDGNIASVHGLPENLIS